MSSSKSQVDALVPKNCDVDSCNGSLEDHHTIMTACSNVGQNIRQSIAETLKSRMKDELCTASENNVLLPAAMIENFEDTLKENLSPSKSAVFDTALEQCSSHLEDVTISDEPNLINGDLCSDKDLIVAASQSTPDLTNPTDHSASHLLNGNHLSLYDLIGQHIRESIADVLRSQSPTKTASQEEDFASVLEISILNKLKDCNLSGFEKRTETDKKNGDEDCCDKDDESSNIEGDPLDAKSESSTTMDDKGGVNDKATKKSQKSSANKKKGEKTIGFFTNQIMKSLSSIQTTDEKFLVLCRKHAESLEKLKTTELQQKQNERLVIQLAREKEQLQADHNRNILAKSRLESLCRELQRQNRAVKEESLLRIREEEEKRKEVASKFQTTLNDISNLMQENSKKNQQLKEENTELAQKLKTLVEHYEMWEKHMEKVVQQKDLEAQLAKVKQAKTNLQLKQETENFLKEKQSLLENMSELQKKCTQLATNEVQLRAELGDYTSKYEEFQTVLNKSNQVFASFKTDMDSTTKKIKKLEKETNIWKQKFEASNKALVEMITDKQTRDKELITATQRVLTLEKLCRALQAERNILQGQLDKNMTETEVVPPEAVQEMEAS